MIKSIVTLLLSGFLAIPAWGFTASMDLPDKVAGADVIVRGVVVKIVHLTAKVDDSGGESSETTMDEGFSGPNAIALFRVTDTVKGKLGPQQGIILIPCGYNFDESPAELTATKEYVLFLDDVGRNYFHPTSAYSMHRVQGGRVCHHGFDWNESFKPEKIEKETEPVEEFVKKIKAAMAGGK